MSHYNEAAVMGLLQPTGRGTPEDKVRLAVIFILASESLPPADAEAVEVGSTRIFPFLVMGGDA